MHKDSARDLPDDARHVLWEKGTEAPFSGALLKEGRRGVFSCVNCNAALFSSDAKFNSGTGWPSFDSAIPGALKTEEDLSHGMRRTEVTCASCGGHLGHVFPDGPTETGERYCINSVCMSFVPQTHDSHEEA
jgi:peptide-methionine (R)-S-oxide reductase